MRTLLASLVAVLCVRAQAPAPAPVSTPRLSQGLTPSPASCTSVAVWSACDLIFDSPAQQGELRAEFRSPRHRTLLIRAFREGGHFILRFAPTEAGVWDYRLTSGDVSLNGKMGQVTAAESSSLGFIRTANVHHFSTESIGSNGSVAPHLWMATELAHFAALPRTDFDNQVAERAQEKFTHLRVTVERNADLSEAAERIRSINAKGMTADVVLASLPAQAQERERYITGIVERFCAFDITWAGIPAFEDTPHARELLKTTEALIQKLDPYDHPRTTMAKGTSAGLNGEGWMNILSYGTPDVNVGAVEHQLFPLPALNAGIHNEKDLWNATMNGQYPASGAGGYMKAWAEFMAQSRYWELEPYFGVDGGRATALEGVEYIVYIEKPGPLEVTLESHNYDVVWMNPATGEMIKQKDYKGEHFTGDPPDKAHDWVLRISREGHKEGMKSYKFESRPVPVQEVEQNPLKIPYEIALPNVEEISFSRPMPFFALKAKRDSRASRSLLVEWTAEVAVDGDGYRIAGTGREGTFNIQPSIASKLPAVLSVRAAFLNANGKAYTLDKAFRLVP